MNYLELVFQLAKITVHKYSTAFKIKLFHMYWTKKDVTYNEIQFNRFQFINIII